MSEVNIKIQYNDDLVQGHLREMIVRSQSFVGVFLYAKAELEKSNAENFSSSGLPVGGWSPRKGIYAWPILVRTGNLAESLTSFAGPDTVIGLRSASFGTSVEYAHFHQYGTSRMAKRKILFEPEGFAKKIGDAAVNHISRGALPGV